MATLRGEGAFTQRSLIVVDDPRYEVKDQEGRVLGSYIDVQVDQSLKNPDKVREGKTPADSNPHLTSTLVDHPNGGQYVDHRVFYSKSQIDKIKEASKVHEVDGKNVYGVTGNIFKNAKGQLLLNTSKDLGPTKNPRFGKNTLENQNAVKLAAKDYAKVKSKEYEKTAEKEVEKTKDDVQVEF